VRRSSDDVERIRGRAARLLSGLAGPDFDVFVDASALNLHSFYTGLEQCFETIARELDGIVPSGRNWQAELLGQMASEVVGVRPPVLSAPTRVCLEDYRAFRHVVRNVYSFNLHPERVRDLVARLDDCAAMVVADLRRAEEMLLELD
jgi:hypothetical protein